MPLAVIPEDEPHLFGKLEDGLWILIREDRILILDQDLGKTSLMG